MFTSFGHGPLISLADDEFVDIRNESTGAEELFNARDDPREESNRVRVDAMQPVVRRFRDRLDQLKTVRSAAAR